MNSKQKSPALPLACWHSDTEFFWFLYKLIQANLPKYFASKTNEATDFVKCLAKLHSESMCAELVSIGKKSKAASPLPPLQQQRSTNDVPTPETLTTWASDSEFYSFLYQLLLRNKGHFKGQLKPTEAFIGVISKLYGKTLAREFHSAGTGNSATLEKFKVVELAEENARLLAEVRELRGQLGLNTTFNNMEMKNKNETLKMSVKK